MNSGVRRKIIDTHIHLYDHQENRYDFLEHTDPILEALIGDYSTLPRDICWTNIWLTSPA